MEYLQSFFKNSYDKGFEKYTKTPVLLSIQGLKKKILSYNFITPDESIIYDNEPNFAISTGKTNGIILIDFDINKFTDDNEPKPRINSVEWFEKKFGSIKDQFGLITETPSGGFHAYCKYTDELPITAVGIEYKELNDGELLNVSIDILSNEGIGFQGRHYKVIKNTEILDIPCKFLNFLKTLHYIPHYKENGSYNSIYKLSCVKNNFKNQLVPIDIMSQIIETPPLDILFMNHLSKLRPTQHTSIKLELTKEYELELDIIDNKIIDYLTENSKELFGKIFPTEEVRRFIYFPIVRNNEHYNSKMNIKLSFHEEGFPNFRVYDKHGYLLDWVKHKHIDKNPILDWSWTKNKVRVKTKCDGLWIINRKVYCTFTVIEIHLA